MRARLGTTFRSLGVRNYRLFLLAQTIKLLGVWMMFTAQDWLVLELTDNSAYTLGVVVALQFAPVLLFSLYGGKLADRYDKARLLAIVNYAGAAVALALAILVLTHTVNVAWVMVFAALLGITNAVEPPARQVLVAEMVGADLIPNALALSAAGFNIARMAGPAVAGVLIAFVGMGPVFLLATVGFLAPVVFLSTMRAADLFPTERSTAKSGVRDGLRYVRSRSDLVMPLALLLVIGVVGFNFPLTLALMAKAVYGADASRFGLLTSALAAGAMIGAFAGSGRRGRPSVYLVLGAAIGFGALETLVAFTPTFTLTALLLVPTGFFTVYLAQSTNQRLQLGADPAYRGRVVSMFFLVFLGTNPLGALLIGSLSDRFGPRFGLWFGGGVSLLAALIALAWELRRSGARIRVRLRPLPRLYVALPAESASPAPVAG